MPVRSKKRIVEICRELRRNSTDAEDRLWQQLRNRKLKGLKFNRQHPVVYQETVDSYFFFVADFYCHEKRLVIELDGPVHEFQLEYDRNREAVLADLGLRVIRFRNEELENIFSVLGRIRDVI